MPNRRLIQALAFSGLLSLLAAGLMAWGAWMAVAPPDAQETTEAVVGELVQGASVGQTFTARNPSLSRVDIQLSTYRRINTGPLIFHLRRSPTDLVDLVTIQLDASQVIDNAFCRFEFAPLETVPGDIYYFFLEAPGAQPGNALTVGGSLNSNAYSGGRAMLHAMPGNGVQDLAFRLYYSPGPAYIVSQFMARLTAHRPGVLGQAWPYLALACAYLVLLSWTGLLLVPAEWVVAALPFRWLRFLHARLARAVAERAEATSTTGTEPAARPKG